MRRIICTSFIWICAFIIFAYPRLIEILINDTKNFYVEYIAIFSKLESLLTNIGLLIITIVDYIIIRRDFSMKISVIILSLLAGVSVLLIWFISRLVNNHEIYKYGIFSLINHSEVWLLGLFLLSLFVIKILTQMESKDSFSSNVTLKGVSH